MWKEIEPELVELTPELAKLHNKRPNLKGDRDVTTTQGKQRIAWLTSKIEKGGFYTPCWGIAEYHGQWYRVDGGHSSTALSQANGHFPKSGHAFIRRFHCETYEDLLSLFNEFDNRKSTRSSSDKIKVHKSAHEELDNVPPTAVADSIAGILLYLNEGNTRKVDDDDRTALVHSEAPFIKFSYPFVKLPKLRRPGTVACMYRGFIADPAETAMFWELVKDESHHDNQNPTRVLARYLRDIGGIGHDVRELRSVPCDVRAQYVKSIHAWNAYQRRETTTLKYHPESDIPPMVLLVNGKFKTI